MTPVEQPGSDACGVGAEAVSDGPLQGLRVLDGSQMLSGPICGMRLGDLGADVIKIEPPVRGEWVRDKYIADVVIDGESPSFLALNRNKRSVTINYKHPQGLAAFYALVETADVFIQNFRVGTAAKLKIDYETLRELNPRLVYCSISGYGESGPYAGRPGQDLIIQGYTGSMWTVGRASDPPMPNGLWAADVMAGQQAAVGILAALMARDRTDRGQKVEVNMLAVAMDCEIQELTTHLGSGLLPRRTDEVAAHAWLGAPYGVFRTADGYLTMAYVSVATLAGLLDCPELAELSKPEDGFERRDEITRLVAAALISRGTDEWIELFHQRGLVAGPVYTYADLVADPHVRETDMIVPVGHPNGGTFRTVNVPIVLSDTPAGIRCGPPALGQDTDAVLGEVLGADADALNALRHEGAI